MKKQYVTVGAETISSNYFRNILRPLDNYRFKPTGGLWASEFSTYSISEWYEYIIYNCQYMQIYKNINTASIFTLKDTAKILKIDSCEQINALAEKYPSYHHILGLYEPLPPNSTIFDFEELSKYYDGIDLNYFSICKMKTFKDWSINTLLLFNLNCIESYQSINIIPRNPYDSEDLPKIIERSENKKINKQSSIYIYLYQYIKNIFNESIVEYQNITDYNNFLETLEIIFQKCVSLIDTEKQKETTELFNILEKEKIPVFRKRQQEIAINNIILNYLSEYLLNNKEKIKQLQKSPIKERKWYIF